MNAADGMEHDTDLGAAAQMPGPEAVLAARRRIADGVIHTRTRAAPNTAERIGAREVWCKFEHEQVTGSFKERGALNAMLALAERGRSGPVITASAGNHAQGVAKAAQRLGWSATVVMPVNTPRVKVNNTRALGARVELVGRSFDEAMAHARGRAAEEGMAVVHPFDDPDVIAGQGTAFLEFFEDAPPIDNLFVPVGGGGLLGGALLAREAMGVKTRIHPVEPAVVASLTLALDGKGEPSPGYATIAEGISVKHAGRIPLALARAHGIKGRDVIEASEEEIERAMVILFMRERTVVEGAGAASLAGALLSPEGIRGTSVGLILCGGNVDARLYGQVLARSLIRQDRRARLRLILDDQPGELARAINAIAKAGANILDVAHDRAALNVPAKQTVVDVIIETDDDKGPGEAVAALHAAGFDQAHRAERSV